MELDSIKPILNMVFDTMLAGIDPTIGKRHGKTKYLWRNIETGPGARRYREVNPYAKPLATLAVPSTNNNPMRRTFVIPCIDPEFMATFYIRAIASGAVSDRFSEKKYEDEESSYPLLYRTFDYRHVNSKPIYLTSPSPANNPKLLEAARDPNYRFLVLVYKTDRYSDIVEAVHKLVPGDPTQHTASSFGIPRDKVVLLFTPKPSAGQDSREANASYGSLKSSEPLVYVDGYTPDYRAKDGQGLFGTFHPWGEVTSSAIMGTILQKLADYNDIPFTGINDWFTTFNKLREIGAIPPKLVSMNKFKVHVLACDDDGHLDPDDPERSRLRTLHILESMFGKGRFVPDVKVEENGRIVIAIDDIEYKVVKEQNRLICPIHGTPLTELGTTDIDLPFFNMKEIDILSRYMHGAPIPTVIKSTIDVLDRCKSSSRPSEDGKGKTLPAFNYSEFKEMVKTAGVNAISAPGMYIPSNPKKWSDIIPNRVIKSIVQIFENKIMSIQNIRDLEAALRDDPRSVFRALLDNPNLTPEQRQRYEQLWHDANKRYRELSKKLNTALRFQVEISRPLMIFAGAPGTGKTVVAEALADYLNNYTEFGRKHGFHFSVVYFDLSSMLQRYSGDTVAQARQWLDTLENMLDALENMHETIVILDKGLTQLHQAQDIPKAAIINWLTNATVSQRLARNGVFIIITANSGDLDRMVGDHDVARLFSYDTITRLFQEPCFRSSEQDLHLGSGDQK